jgi:hypothetical protein
VNTDLTGTVRMAGETQTGIRVEIHLDNETMSLVSPYGELGTWPLSGMGISARVDGFHLKVEGEELVLSTNDDVAFALGSVVNWLTPGTGESTSRSDWHRYRPRSGLLSLSLVCPTPTSHR